MAKMIDSVEVRLKIPIKSKLRAADGKLYLDMQAETDGVADFIKELGELCEKYGFTEIITETPSEG